MHLKKPLDEKSKGRFKYEGMLKAMPPDIVKELARRRMEEVKRYVEANFTPEEQAYIYSGEEE